MTNEGLILSQIAALTNAVHTLTAMVGARLTRDQLAERIGVHRNTIGRWMVQPDFPRPGRDGKWLLSDVMAWEARKA